MNVETILRRKGRRVVTIRRDAPLVEAAEKLRRYGIGALVVSDDGEGIDGILYERDIVAALDRLGAEIFAASVTEAMTAPVVTCAPDDSVAVLMAEMTNRRIRHFPVIADGRLGGIVSIGDLVKSRLDEVEHEASSLRSFIAGA